ncbi:hypothetical protein [Spiroplasma endosymbiont of Lonchoptera lutea]|uniref:hypothetical protein n=1 Tax=Spiroplasma endosymbiont of Lonchoptera lutea TaxID=3066297 RepID=UPI0030D3CCB3
MLTTITSLSSITPIILANASAEVPQNKIVNNEINSLQTNNLENLIRNKKNINNQEIEYNVKKIFEITNATYSYNFKFDKKNNLYVSTSHGVFVLKQGENQLVQINGIHKELNMNSHLIEIDNDDNVYFGTNKGIYILKHNEILKNIPTATKINDIENIVRTIVIDEQNNVYIGTHMEGTYFLKYGTTHISKININNDVTWAINFDNNQNVYIGTSSGVYVVKLNELKFKQKDRQILKKIINHRTNNIVVDSKKNIYFNTNDGFFVLKQGENTVTEIKLNLSKYDFFSCIYVDGNDNVYFETNKGIYILKSSELKKQNPNTIKINWVWNSDFNIKVNCFIFNENNVYFGTSDGLFVLKQGETTVIKINATNNIDNLKSDNNGNIYFSNNYTAYVLKQGETIFHEIYGIDIFERQIDGDTKVNNHINSININSNNDIYFSTILGFLYILENTQETKLNKENEIFEKWYKVLQHDELKIEFNFNTVNNIIVLFENNKKQEFIKELKTIINNIPKSDHSGVGGSITEEDINIVVNLIWQHFSDFHETYRNMAKNQKLIIKTNTIGYFDNENVNNSIYIN